MTTPEEEARAAAIVAGAMILLERVAGRLVERADEIDQETPRAEVKVKWLGVEGGYTLDTTSSRPLREIAACITAETTSARAELTQHLKTEEAHMAELAALANEPAE